MCYESGKHGSTKRAEGVILPSLFYNAVCHRNYFEYGMNVMVEVFDDRVEIYNPGGIPKGLKESEFGTKSVPRNPIIAILLHRAGYIEKMGTGIKKIRDAMADEGLEAPVFTSTMFFTVVFKRPPMHTPSVESYGLPADITLKEMKLCQLIDQDAKVTIAKIAEHLGVGEATVSRMLKTLTEKGVISREGPDKRGSRKIMWKRE